MLIILIACAFHIRLKTRHRNMGKTFVIKRTSDSAVIDKKRIRLRTHQLCTDFKKSGQLKDHKWNDTVRLNRNEKR